jgi:peptide/nickel transport system ATP-binding protein
MTLLKARGVKAYYEVGKRFVKAGVSIELEKGIVLGLAGESGCGKSTLANTLMMNIKPPLRLIDGSIEINGILITKVDKEFLKKNVWGKLVALIPQSSLNALMPTMKIKNFVIDIIKQHEELDESEIVLKAEKTFEELGLPVDVLNLYPHELSGGMRQRVTIAIATLLNPRLLIADEVTSALDVSTQKQVLKMLLNLKKKGKIDSIIFVSHDVAVLRQIADMIAIMYAGKIVELGPTEEIIFNPLHPYTAALVNSVVTPEPEIKKRGLAFLPGEPPDLSKPPPGCRFHPRCPYATDKCKKEEPLSLSISSNHLVSCHLYET